MSIFQTLRGVKRGQLVTLVVKIASNSILTAQSDRHSYDYIMIGDKQRTLALDSIEEIVSVGPAPIEKGDLVRVNKSLLNRKVLVVWDEFAWTVCANERPRTFLLKDLVRIEQ